MSTAQETKTRAVNLTDDQLSDLISAANLADDEERSAGTYTGVIRLLNAAQSATWQSEPPTEDGWYWWREYKSGKPEPVILSTQPSGARWIAIHKSANVNHVERISGQWWPIPVLAPPTEKEDA